MINKNYISLISSLFLLLLLAQITLAQAQNCNTPYNARSRGDFCITTQTIDVSSTGYQINVYYTFKIENVNFSTDYDHETDGRSYKTSWYAIPYGNTSFDPTQIPPNLYLCDESVGSNISTSIRFPTVDKYTIYAKTTHIESGLIKEGYLDIDLIQDGNSIISEKCGENSCEIVGLINGGFEDKYWTNSKWIRKNKHADGQVIEYSNFKDDYISDCEARAENLKNYCLSYTGNFPAFQELCDDLYEQNIQNCNQQYIPFFGDCSQNAETQKAELIDRLNALNTGTPYYIDAVALDFFLLNHFNNTMINCFQEDRTFADNTLTEHRIIDREDRTAPLYQPVVLPSEYLNNPNITNNNSLLLGREGSRLAWQLNQQLELSELYNYNIEASVEQTFFVEEAEVARLDIWYAWVAKYYAEEDIEDDNEREALFEAPVFSIELFRTDADGNDYLLESFVEFQEDNSGESIMLELGTNITSKHVYKDWGFQGVDEEREPFTLDLSPYRGELVKLKITSYDRFIQDAETGNVTKRLDSYAMIDIACASCCVPAQDFAEGSYSVSDDGVVTITRPQLPCELLEEEEDRCDPTFFYQITSGKGEPYVLEGKGTSIKFFPEYPGQYTIYYKHSESCCWNETPLLVPVSNVVTSNQADFSNELKFSGVYCIPSFYMDSVLAVGASSFIDRQFVNTQEIAQSADKVVIEDYLLTQNPYLTGERGVWRTEGSYAYVTERKGTKTVRANDASLARTGGTFDLNMFNWQNRGVIPENWRKTGETSRYNPYNYGVESRDVLGRYSSALYGYNGQLSTAVCANAAYTEIAYDGFEDESQTSNFKITNPAPNTTDRSMTLKVLWAREGRGVLEGYVPPNNGSTIDLNASLIAYVLGKQDIIEIKPTNTGEAIPEKIKVTLTYRDETTSWFAISAIEDDYTIDSRLFTEQWYGSLAIARDLSVMNNLSTSTASIYLDGAHTGAKSLQVTGNTEILQSNLLLKPTQKYIISAWVKVAGAANQIYTYEDVDKVGIQLAFYREDGSPISTNSPLIVPVGNIIEGWQRLEGVVEVPEGAFYTTTILKAESNIVYYDDIRIFPADGSMKTFVYDPINYLLRAVLDENNYASLYFYDDAERLFLTQKETREGIYTIQENGGFINHRLPPPDED